MSKTLVAYFSASGATREVAKKLSIATNSDLFEIKPEKPYTDEDLDWRNKNSRSSIEMNDKTYRPAISEKINNMDEYDTIYLGFPIWWYVAPTIINTFLEQYDFSGKTIIPFATSGSSGMGNTVNELKISCLDSTNIKWNEGKRFPNSVSVEELKSWAESIEN